jgi:DHA1 family tetracycline resistance protein-like MFS transporter
MQFLFMPLIGALSDAYGRRKIMLLSLLGLSADYLLMGLAPTIAFLYAGRLIAGALGATFSTANAYIADISPPETRAQNFGLVGAAFGIGFILGPAIGGILAEPKFLGSFASPQLPFFVAAGLGMLNVIYGFFFLPETLKPEDRRPVKASRANPYGALKSLARVKGVHGMLFVYFLMSLAHTAYPTTYTISMQEKLGWSPGDVGISLGVFGLASFIVQGGLIRVIIPKIGQYWAAIIGIACASLGYMAFGYAKVGWMVYAAGPLAALAGLYGPSITNMMSSRISKSEQGELQGAIGAAQALSLMVGPLAMAGAFHLFTKDDGPAYIPGASFYLAALLAALGLLAFFMLTNKADRTRTEKKEEVSPLPEEALSK